MKSDSIQVCSGIVDEVFEKAAGKIINKLFEHMKPHFVKKQMLIQATAATVFGKNCADKQPFLVEENEDEEPVSQSLFLSIFLIPVDSGFPNVLFVTVCR